MATLTVNTTLGDGSVTRAKLNDALVVTEAEGIAANDNDNTIPTSAAVKDYVDANAGITAPLNLNATLGQDAFYGTAEAGEAFHGVSLTGNAASLLSTGTVPTAYINNQSTGLGLEVVQNGGTSADIAYFRGDDGSATFESDGGILWTGTGAATTRNNVLPSKTGNALKVLRVNGGETDYELADGVTDGSALSIGLQFPNAGLKIADQNADHTLVIVPAENLTADRQLSIRTGDASRTLRLDGTLTVTADADVSGTNTGDQTITLTGDVTGTGTGSFAATIANDAVTNAKAANMAQATIKGRQAAAGTGDPEDLTADQVSTILDSATDPFQRASRELTASISSDFVTSSATYVDVTGLSVTLAANSRYMVLIDGAYQSANTGTGAMVSITRTGSPTVCNFERRLYTAAATNTMLGSVGNVDDLGSPGTSVDTINTDRHWNMFGIVVTGASPCVIQVRAVRGGAANDITIRQGSSIVAHRVS